MLKRKSYNVCWCYEEKTKIVYGNKFVKKEKEAYDLLKFVFNILKNEMVYYNVGLYINNKFKVTISSKQVVKKENKAWETK